MIAGEWPGTPGYEKHKRSSPTPPQNRPVLGIRTLLMSVLIDYS